MYKLCYDNIRAKVEKPEIVTVGESLLSIVTHKSKKKNN